MITRPRGIARHPWLMTLTLLIVGLNAEVGFAHDAQKGKLVITGFSHDSPLKAAGAKDGDAILRYDGYVVNTIEELKRRKDECLEDEVEVALGRGEKTLTVTVAKGRLGVMLKLVTPDHLVAEDAVVIKGIGKLDWGIGMENSFFGALCRIDAKYGAGLSYADLVGLSGYAFRVHFFDRWCPSSPDATCGKNVGVDALKNLGYDANVRMLKIEENKDEPPESLMDEAEMRTLIKETIDNGWPVLAIDLIEVPEWGLITGYQKEGQQLFCRTYFDHTEGYELARKTPWVIVTLIGKSEVDLHSLHKRSLEIAKELYSTERYGKYVSGLAAYKEWLDALEDDKQIDSMDIVKRGEVIHANWWIYHSLMEARTAAKDYLIANKDKFGVDPGQIESLADVYKQQADLLMANIESIPSPMVSFDPKDWTPAVRAKQIETLKQMLKLEKAAYKLIKKL